jgi:hypothetical protein
VSIDESDSLRVWSMVSLVAAGGALFLLVFGVPGVDLHGPLHYIGIMDPLCGGTRSWYLALRGRWREAFEYNPAGPILMAVAALGLLRLLAGCVARRWIGVRVPVRSSLILASVALIALEFNQQSHAALLTAAWPG